MKPVLTRRSLPFIGFWLVGAGITAWSGTRVDPYMLHVMGVPLPHPYPWQGVLLIIGIQTIEVLLFYALVRPGSYQRSWVRALLALLLSLMLLGFFGASLMHAPPYMVWHWLWIACASVTLLVLFSISVIQKLRAHAA